VVTHGVHDADPYIRIRAQSLVRGSELVDQFEVERITLLRPVDPDQQHVCALFDDYLHGSSTRACAA
jgi:hypothetical protein